MPERSDEANRPPTLGRGFSVARFVVSEELDDLAYELLEISEDDPALEVRLPYPEGEEAYYIDRRVAAKIVKMRDIHQLNLQNKGMPLKDVYADFDRTVPEINYPIEDAELAGVVDAPPDRQGGQFIAAAFDESTGLQLVSERDRILRRTMVLGGMREREPRLYTPDTTLAYLGGQALQGTLEAVNRAVQDYLPLPIALERATKRPRGVRRHRESGGAAT